MEGADWMQFDRCGKHNGNSHDDEKAKYLKYDQIVAVTDAVTIAPQQSAAQLRPLALTVWARILRWSSCCMYCCLCKCIIGLSLT